MKDIFTTCVLVEGIRLIYDVNDATVTFVGVRRVAGVVDDCP